MALVNLLMDHPAQTILMAILTPLLIGMSFRPHYPVKEPRRCK